MAPFPGNRTSFRQYKRRTYDKFNHRQINEHKTIKSNRIGVESIAPSTHTHTHSHGVCCVWIVWQALATANIVWWRGERLATVKSVYKSRAQFLLTFLYPRSIRIPIDNLSSVFNLSFVRQHPAAKRAQWLFAITLPLVRRKFRQNLLETILAAITTTTMLW